MNAETMLEGQDLEAVEKLKAGYEALRTELGKVIVGQEKVLDELLIAIFSKGHCLLVGVPGQRPVQQTVVQEVQRLQVA